MIGLCYSLARNVYYLIQYILYQIKFNERFPSVGVATLVLQALLRHKYFNKIYYDNICIINYI